MSNSTVPIRPEQMKALARYEETFDRYIELPDSEDDSLIFPGKYQMTLDDLYAALRNLLEKDPTAGEFGDLWFYPLSRFADAFGIPDACGWVDDEEGEEEPDEEPEDEEEPEEEAAEEPVPPDLVRGLPLADPEIFSDVWSGLEDVWAFADEEDHLSELPLVKTLLDDVASFLANRGRPVAERDFTDHQKKEFIRHFEQHHRLKHSSDLERRLCRRFTDELCEKGSGTALHLKGYACYGGNELYPCDWKASRDCMLRLYEKTDDPSYANTLGYIYYYGRCTDGVPEYEKAFEMFTVAAANGLHEGIYKLADMFRHGYACKQSPRTARALYGMVYDDCYEKFLKGDDEGNFADAALRMGSVYLKGIGETPDPEEAYRYYLQADYAAKRRAAKSDFFGDATVAANIRKALAETRAALPEDFFLDRLPLYAPGLFQAFIEDGYRADLSVARREDGTATVLLKRLPRHSDRGIAPILLTCPEIDLCGLMTGAELTATSLKTSFDAGAEQGIRYDFCTWNDTEDRLDLYYDDAPAGWISADGFFMERPQQKTPSGRLLTLVSVAFRPGGRTYDYLCEVPGVRTGDRVIVPGYEGETETEVQAVFTSHESELGLPAERYKKVIRRV